MTMENYTLSEAKKLFGKLYKEGRTEEAALVAKEITEKSPEAVSGYYYSLVLATDNFKTYGDAEKTQALYDLFAARADEATAKKYGDKLKALKEAPRAEKFAEKPAAAAAVKADKKGSTFSDCFWAYCACFSRRRASFRWDRSRRFPNRTSIIRRPSGKKIITIPSSINSRSTATRTTIRFSSVPYG